MSTPPAEYLPSPNSESANFEDDSASWDSIAMRVEAENERNAQWLSKQRIEADFYNRAEAAVTQLCSVLDLPHYALLAPLNVVSQCIFELGSVFRERSLHLAMVRNPLHPPPGSIGEECGRKVFTEALREGSTPESVTAELTRASELLASLSGVMGIGGVVFYLRRVIERCQRGCERGIPYFRWPEPTVAVSTTRTRQILTYDGLSDTHVNIIDILLARRAADGLVGTHHLAALLEKHGTPCSQSLLKKSLAELGDGKMSRFHALDCSEQDGYSVRELPPGTPEQLIRRFRDYKNAWSNQR